jgi:hypothetical protein
VYAPVTSGHAAAPPLPLLAVELLLVLPVVVGRPPVPPLAAVLDEPLLVSDEPPVAVKPLPQPCPAARAAPVTKKSHAFI